MKTKLFKIRRFFYPLWVIGVVYTFYLCIQILFLFLGRLLSPLLNWAWKLEVLTAEVVRLNFFLHLFLGLIPLLVAFNLAEKAIFRQRLLPRFFPPSAWARRDLCFGLALGFSLFALLFLAFFALGWVRFAAPPFVISSELLWIAPTFIVAALFEELFYRGLQLPVFTAHWGLSPAIAFSAFLFSLAHLNNPHLNFGGLFAILLAGVLFALTYLETGTLYLPVALHFSWNFWQNLFGFRVSGLAFPTFFQLEITGPTLWTGGAFGPEAGLAGLILLGLATVATLRYGDYRRNALFRRLGLTPPTAKDRP
ncbi:CPBP family intramembrane glutamic endopeptidase [Capillibacterium thermochitinicola]|uniref:CPBP family intramembrane metalloprotease n=1 Tax=Capillibacterium thermochitinicola TaxID=2699427 RepID=A0A8J6HZR9_9FIRM|nr:type II CAAX endopeptidase family protein [Capillibacterium thermochitinicola]MBA2132338.1 CPBP family intramembrane metalloprotease [Capillibacterium thermochitinicola]